MWKKQEFDLKFSEEGEQSKAESLYQESPPDMPSEPSLVCAQGPFR